MSVWGKLIGGAIGFAIGGPLGALVGVGTGHLIEKHRKSAKQIDRVQAEKFRQINAPGIDDDRENRQASFIIAFVALAAKLSKIDGRITQNEIHTLMRVFPLPGYANDLVSSIFQNAEKDPSGYEVYAHQIAGLFRNDRATLEDLLGALVLVARADGILHPAERNYLEKVGAIFGFRAAEIARIIGTFAQPARPEETDPYAVLGIDREASDREVKSAHRKILRESHPDVATGRGLPEELIEVCNRKMAAANAAYDRIKQERGIA